MRGCRLDALRLAVGIPFEHRPFADPHKNAWRRAKRAYNRPQLGCAKDPGGVPVGAPGRDPNYDRAQPAGIWLSPIRRVRSFFARCNRAQRKVLVKLAKNAGRMPRQALEFAVRAAGHEVGYS